MPASSTMARSGPLVVPRNRDSVGPKAPKASFTAKRGVVGPPEPPPINKTRRVVVMKRFSPSRIGQCATGLAALLLAMVFRSLRDRLDQIVELVRLVHPDCCSSI